MHLFITRTSDSSITPMTAVLFAPRIVRAVCDKIFFTSTIDFGQPDGLICRSRTKSCSTGWAIVSQLSAEHSRSIYVPVIPTNSTPCVVMIDLHPAFQAVSPSHQSYARRSGVIYVIILKTSWLRVQTLL